MAGTSDAPYLADMRILLMSLGSRGDMEPFLALGAELKAEGAAVLCWTIRSLAEEEIARQVAQNVTFEDYLPRPRP